MNQSHADPRLISPLEAASSAIMAHQRQDLGVLKQRNLLRQFYQLYNPHHVDESPELSRVRNEYNWLAQRQRHQRQTCTLPDPFDFLPPELLLQCFSEVPHDRSDGLFSCLQVSRRWRYFLMSASTFWTRVFIGQGTGNVRRVEMGLQYSQSAPLILEVFLQPQQDEWWLELLKPHAHRIKEIHFRHHAIYDGDYSMREPLFPQALKALQRLDRLSALETLAYVNGQQSYPPRIPPENFPVMPALRNVLGFNLESEVLGMDIISLQNLRRFTTGSPLRGIIPTLTQCSSLEHIELLESFDNLTRFIVERVDDDSPWGDITQLPLLKTLIFIRNGLNAIKPVLTLRGSQLTTLYIRISWTDMANASYLRHLPSLSHLRIYHPVERTDDSSVPLPTFPPLPQVKEFHFIQQPDIVIESMPSPTQHFVALFHALGDRMNQVKTLTLGFFETPPVEALLRYLSTLKLLDRVELSYSELTSDASISKYTLPSLQSIRLSNETLLQYLDLPLLEDLWVDTISSDGSQSCTPNSRELVQAKSTPTEYLHGSRFPRVQKLSWDGSISFSSVTFRRCSTITTTFSSIRTLVFAEAYARKDSNDFCEVLLRSPSSCPRLETISFHCYPSWDLLCHMLLRRNIMPGSSVTPLTSIQLPGYPSNTLLAPITALLAKRIPKIPAISDIALTFRNGLFDATKPGCDCCLDCGLTCNSQVQIIDPNLPVPAQPDLSLSSTEDSIDVATGSEASDTEDGLIEPLRNWFDGWPRRRQMWNSFSEAWGYKYRRSFACGKHDFVHLVTITGSMMQEVQLVRGQ